MTIKDFNTQTITHLNGEAIIRLCDLLLENCNL